jgi:putative DNA primase/helicase
MSARFRRYSFLPAILTTAWEIMPKENKSGVEPVVISPTAKPWEEPVEATQVLGEICQTIERFVWLKPSQCRVVALWIVLSYLHDAIDILPILLVTSPEENCGKSTLIKLVYFLANRSIIASKISGPAIYRTYQGLRSDNGFGRG